MGTFSTLHNPRIAHGTDHIVTESFTGPRPGLDSGSGSDSGSGPGSAFSGKTPRTTVPLSSAHQAEELLDTLLDEFITLEELKEIARIPATDTHQTRDTLVDSLLKGDLVVSVPAASGLGGSSTNSISGSSTGANPITNTVDSSELEPSLHYSKEMQATLLAHSNTGTALLTRRPSSLSTDSKIGNQGQKQSAIPKESTNTDKTPQYKFVVEVAGCKHSSKQRLVLKSAEKGAKKSTESSGERPIIQTARQDRQRTHRSLVEFKHVDNSPKTIALEIPMSGGPNLQLTLLSDIMPVNKDKQQDCWESIISPIKPLRFLDENNDINNSDLLPEGWLYVFWRGRCWRELQVHKSNSYRDVDINWYRGQSTDSAREAKGHWLDSIWVPSQLNGTPQVGALGFQLAYSPAQWPMQWIETVEGNTDQRAQVCTSLDSLGKYKEQRHFQQCDNTISDIESALLLRGGNKEQRICPDGKSLRKQRKNNLAAVYLQPAGEVMRLKVTNKKGEPWKGKKMAVTVGGKVTEHTVNADGIIEVALFGDQTIDGLDAWVGSELGSESSPSPLPSHSITINTDQLDDVSTVKGQQARLNNLEHKAGVEDGLMGRNTRNAIKSFQQQYKLDVDGIAGPITQQKLTEVHGS